MQRHGDEQRLIRSAYERRHVAGHRPRNRNLAAVFEADSEASRQVVISNRCTASRNPRRRCEANTARVLLRGPQRQPAGRAARITQEFNLFPALGTKAVHVAYDDAAACAAGRKRKIQHPTRGTANHINDHRSLSLGPTPRTSAAVAQLFDTGMRALRRDRAARSKPALFLHERAFEDCLERVDDMQRRFEKALLIGCPDPSWPERLSALANDIVVRDPGRLFADAVGGATIVEDALEPAFETFDLVVSIGTLDTVNDLPLALRLIHHVMKDGGLFIGAMSGGETLPQLRAAMRAADARAGTAAPHVHPRIEASALAPLLSDAGFANPVVDIDRVAVSYSSLDRLVADLRAMGATNVLTVRPRVIGRAARAAATKNFSDAGNGTRTTETFEILHFVGWATFKG